MVVSYFPRTKATHRHAVGLAFCGSFVIGYAFSPQSWSPILPQRHWQWFHVLATLCLALGPLAFVRGVGWLERGFAFLALSLVAAWLLTPTWNAIEPYRLWYVLYSMLGMAALMLTLSSLAGNERHSQLFLFQLVCSAALVAIVIVWQSHSLKVSQIATIAAGALGGCWFACWLRPHLSTSLAGALPAYATVVGGLAYVGACFLPPNDRQIWGLLLIPAAPLASVIARFAFAQRLAGWKSKLVGMLPFLLVLAAAMTWILISEPAMVEQEW